MNITYILTLFVIFFGLFLGFIWLLFLAKDELKDDIGKDKNFPSVTFAIPAHNEEKGIEKTIRSVLAVNYPKDKYQIIIVDDGSTDNTLKIINKFSKEKNLKIIHKEKNQGKALALNSALEEVGTEFFACLDADSTIDPNALINNLKYFDKKVGAVISIIKVRNPKGVLGFTQLVEYVLNSLYRRVFAINGFLTVTPGVLSVYRTNLVKKIKGFDKDIITEDFEIALRIIKQGYKIGMSPESFTYTSVPLTLKAFWKQRVRWYIGFVDTNIKHRDIIFSPKYDMLGLFFIPLTLFGPISLMLALGLIFYKAYFALYRIIFRIIFAWNTINFFDFSGLHNYLLQINYFIDVPLLFSFIIIVYFMLKAIAFSDEKLTFKIFIGSIIYIFIYPYITLFQWIHASLLYLFKKERKW